MPPIPGPPTPGASRGSKRSSGPCSNRDKASSRRAIRWCQPSPSGCGFGIFRSASTRSTRRAAMSRSRSTSCAPSRTVTTSRGWRSRPGRTSSKSSTGRFGRAPRNSPLPTRGHAPPCLPISGAGPTAIGRSRAGCASFSRTCWCSTRRHLSCAATAAARSSVSMSSTAPRSRCCSTRPGAAPGRRRRRSSR